jgi:hypothetical protein
LADKVYRTVVGTVEFDPRDGKAGEKDVRNITVQSAGFKDSAIKVGATIWPSHSHIKVAKGDVVVLKGSFSRNTSEKEDGTPVTYNNLSVASILVLGQMDEGVRDNEESTTKSTATQLTDDEELPF